MVDIQHKQFDVYRWLWENEERPSQRKLSNILGLNRMAVSRAVMLLEWLGAIKVEREETLQGRAIMSTLEITMSPEELGEKLLSLSPLAQLLEDE